MRTHRKGSYICFFLGLLALPGIGFFRPLYCRSSLGPLPSLEFTQAAATVRVHSGWIYCNDQPLQVLLKLDCLFHWSRASVSPMFVHLCSIHFSIHCNWFIYLHLVFGSHYGQPPITVVSMVILLRLFLESEDDVFHGIKNLMIFYF